MKGRARTEQLSNAKAAIFVPDGAGHHPSYVRLWANYISNCGYCDRFLFVVDGELLGGLRLLDSNGLKVLEDIETRVLTAEESARLRTRGALSRGRHRWNFLRQLVSTHGELRHIFLGYLDIVQLQLAAGLRLPRKVGISGIFFRTRSRSIYGMPSIADPKGIAAHIRRQMTYHGILRNRCVRTVFCLDEYFVDEHRSGFGHEKLRYLPDPMLIVKESLPMEFQTSENDGSPGKLKYLFFGAVTERKGILQFLAALKNVPIPVEVAIVGKIDPTISAQVVKAVAEVKSAGIVTVQILDEFVSDASLSHYVERCDCIVAPYQDFVGSSGVLLWAAAFGKPVITQNSGLLGRMTTDNGMGIAIDARDPAEIARAMQTMHAQYNQLRSKAALGNQLLRSKHDPAKFAQNVVETLVAECD